MENTDFQTTTKENKGVALLEKAYEFALNGIPMVSESLEELVMPYLTHAKDKDTAIANFIKNQKLKCSTTGFLTGLGGLITLPVALPADLLSSVYMEVRMIAGIAMIRGYNVKDDSVKTAVYMCLIGNAVSDVVKQVGIKMAQQITIKKLLPKITRPMLVKINRAVGFRLITKGGSKGLINLEKAIPVLGGIVGGVWNWTEVDLCAKYAKKMFDENES